MQAIIFNHDKSKISQASESLALRACYLVCDQVCAAGTSHISINIENNYHFKQTEGKIKAVQSFLHSHKDENRLQAINDAGNVHGMLKNKKTRTSAEVVLFKRAEKIIDTLFAELRKRVIHATSVSGLPQLHPLFNIRDGSFSCYPVDYTTQEAEADDRFSVSKLMDHTTEAEGTDLEIFCLTHEFFHPDYLSGQAIIIAEPVDTLAADAVYLEPFFTFPNLNLLSAAELVQVRTKLAEPTSGWRTKTNKWIQMLRAEEKNTGSFFFESLLTCRDEIQEKINEIEILKIVARAQEHKVQMQLCMGAIPLHFIWNFYRHGGALHDPAWNKLCEKKEKNTVFLKHEAVFSICIPGSEHLLTVNEEKKMQGILPSKKSISID